MEEELNETEEDYDPFSLKSKEIDNEEMEEYHPFSLSRGENNEEQNEDYHPFSLTKNEINKEIDENYHPFSLNRDEGNQDQSEDAIIFSENEVNDNIETDGEFKPNKESQDKGKIENKEEYENLDFQSTLLIHEDSEMDADYQQNLNAESEEPQEQELEPDPEEYEKNIETIYDPDEIAFIRDMEELGSDLKELHEESGCSKDELEEYDNTGFIAEQTYQKIKEKNEEIGEKEQHLEELELQEIVEQIGDPNRENLTEEEFKEESDDLPKEIMDSEEFKYLWGEYDKLQQEGKRFEEISELMHKAEETYQMLKNYEEELEEIYERQEKQDLESINHKNEEEPEDYRKEVESVYEAEYFIDAEIKLQAEGKSPKEVTEEMQKVEDGYEFEEEVELRFDQQRKAILKSVNHEDEEDDVDQREEIDRVDVIECVVEAEGEFHKQEKSQEELDEETENIANSFYKSEIGEQQQNEQEKGVSEELGETEITKPKLALEVQDRNTHTSVDNNDENIEVYPEMENRETIKEPNTECKGKNDLELEQESINESIEEENKLETEGSEEEEYEKLQQLYHQETGRRPTYRRRETKEFSQWLEHQKLKMNKLEEKEEKKQEEERWKRILKEWIEESKEEVLNSELKLVLKEILQEYEVLENLCGKYVKTNLTETERDKWFSDLNKYLKKYPIHLHLHQNIYGFKVYVQESHPWDINRIKNRFLRHLAKNYENLKQSLKIHYQFIRHLIKQNQKLVNKPSPIENKRKLEDFKSIDKNLYLKENKNSMAQDFNITFINVHKFRQKIIYHLKNLLNLIECTSKQREFIWQVSIKVLGEFISRIESSTFTIRKNTNFKAIAGTIIYTIIISNKDMPKITMNQISNLANTFDSIISKFYKNYFKNLCPRTNFLFSAFKGFKRIRNIISLYIFDSIKDLEVETSEIILHLRENVLENINLPKELTQKDIDVLHEFATVYQYEFIKYFSDLTEVVKQLLISGGIYKQIDAFIIVKLITEILEEKGVSLLQTSKSFYRSVVDIFDFLKKKFPDFFPIRMIRIKTEAKLSKKEFTERHYDYIKIVGKRLKLYIIRHIYNGKYFKNGKGKCPECLKEGLGINTDISRLSDLEFHHQGNEKENNFNEDYLYKAFLEHRSNPDFLKDLISLMESENVELLCTNHHAILHDDYYRYFKYLVNWENIFSLTAEQIHVLIRISVNNFIKTKNKSVKEKERIGHKLVKKLKKRYIIERIYGEYCSTCREFNIKEHLPAFQFNHLDEEKKTVEATDLYDTNSCSEIVQKLEKEIGGYICGNCHSVIHYKYVHLLEDIYDDENIIKKVRNDYNQVVERFKLIHDISSIEDLLKKTLKIRDGIERYLSAIYEISKLKGYTDTNDLKDHLQVSDIRVIGKFFRKNRDFIRNYVNIEVGRSYHPTKYTLNDEGKKFVFLMYRFKNYYKSLKLD